MQLLALICLLVFEYRLLPVSAFPMVSNSTQTCINVYAQYPQNFNDSLVLYQNCNKAWFYGTTTEVQQIKLTPTRQAKSLTFEDQEFFMQSVDNRIFYGNLVSLAVVDLGVSCNSLYLHASHSKNVSQLLLLCNESIKVFYVINEHSYSSFSSYFDSRQRFTMMRCSKRIKVCFLVSDSNKIYSYYLQNGLMYDLRVLYEGNSTFIPNQIQLKESNSSQLEMFVGYKTGEVDRYLFDNDTKKLEYIRSYSLFNASTLYQMKVESSFLVASDDQANVVVYNIDDNQTISESNYQQNLTKDNKSLLLNLCISTSDSAVRIFNKPNRFVDQQSLLAIKYSCSLMTFFDRNSRTCFPCSSDCTSCYSNNGSCLSCMPNYFLVQGSCQSCYYSSDILTNYLDKCFSKMEQGVMNNSEKMVTVLTIILTNFAIFLNVCGILFLFVKLINNWSLLSLYFFLPIKNVPFFLENILAMLFTSFNSSVLQALNIKINFDFGIADIYTNEKLQLANVTTDFVAYNGENMIMFIYSLILIMTVLRLIHAFLGRWSISLFQDNTAIAMLDEFIACFTVAYLPSNLIVGFSGFPTLRYKINAIFSYILMLVALIAPFLFLIIGNKQRISCHSKQINLSDPQQIKKVLKQCRINRKKVWITESQREKCFYCILSFSISLLACNSQPLYFLSVVGLVHVFSVLNIILSSSWSMNQLIQRLNFLLFHCCYILLYMIDNDSTKLYISMAAVILIIVGGTHELFSTILTQIYTLYKLIKRKIQEKKKIEALFRKIDEARSNPLRSHPMKMGVLSKKQKVGKQKTARLNVFTTTIISYQAEEPSQLAQDRAEIDEKDHTGGHVMMELKSSRKRSSRPSKSAKQIEEQERTEKDNDDFQPQRQETKLVSRIGRSRRRLRSEKK